METKINIDAIPDEIGNKFKTINGESIFGEGNIVVGVDTSNLATKEEINSLVNDAITSAITNVLNAEV